jgi:hypothetical protein
LADGFILEVKSGLMEDFDVDHEFFHEIEDGSVGEIVAKVIELSSKKCRKKYFTLNHSFWGNI